MKLFLTAVAFLAACVFFAPLLSKILHEKMLKRLGVEGAMVVPRFWALSGLRIIRPEWQGVVDFRSACVGGGHPGHLVLRAEFKDRGKPAFPAAPAPGADARIRTGDDDFDRMIGVVGDPEFARKLLGPQMRERLLELNRKGGRVVAVGTGSLEINGPLLTRPDDLRQFLELCDAIVQGTALASGS
jgi:hypothetical protein